MNPLYELAVQCVAGQSALRRLAGCVNDTYHQAVLFAAAKRLWSYANEVYLFSLGNQSVPLERVRVVSLEKMQTLVDVCNLRLELLEETFNEALAKPLPGNLHSSLQRQANEFAEIQAMIRCALHNIEPFASVATMQTSRVTRQGFALGLPSSSSYAEA